MRQEEREALLREDVPRAQTARERRQLEAIGEDLRSSPLRGRPLRHRLRNFRPAAEGYLASLGGPLPYMQRLREIERLMREHEEGLLSERSRLSAVTPPEQFEKAWDEALARWPFHEVNDLIARHNRWFPVEARLPMDPRRGDFALVNGRDYRLQPLDAAWGDQTVRAGEEPRATTTSVKTHSAPQAR